MNNLYLRDLFINQHSIIESYKDEIKMSLESLENQVRSKKSALKDFEEKQETLKSALAKLEFSEREKELLGWQEIENPNQIPEVKDASKD